MASGAAWGDIDALIGAGDHGAATRALLGLYRASPSPWLADLIDRVGAQAAREPLPGKTVADRRTAWDRVEKKGDPLEVPRLVEALLPFGAGPAADRLAKLASRGADPRLSGPLLRWVEQRPNGYQGRSSLPFWDRVGEALIASRDARAIPALRALVDRLGASHAYSADSHLARSVLPGVLEALGTAAHAEPPEEARALLDRLAPPSEPGHTSARDIQSLFEAVYQDPSSDEARLVLSDALQQSGDPRGEFIALQLKPKRSAQDNKRAKALEAEHGATWLGEIAPALPKSNRRFERGFLSKCRVSSHPNVDTLVGTKILATVSELDLAAYGSSELFEQTPLGALQVIEGRCFSIFRASRPLPVRLIRGVTDAPIHGVTEVLCACGSLPSLEELHISVGFEPLDRWREALASPFAPSLRRLALLGVESLAARPWREMVEQLRPDLEWFELAESTTRLRFARGHVSVTRDVDSAIEGGAVVSGTGVRDRALEDLAEILESGLLRPEESLSLRLVRGRFGQKTLVSREQLSELRDIVSGLVRSAEIEDLCD